MNFPILSSITFLPLIGAFFIFLTRSEKNQSDKNPIYLSLFTSFTNFFLVLFLWYSFDPTTYDFQFVEETTWISGFIKFKFGIDGISILFILLTAFITPICIISCINSTKSRLKEFLIAILVLETFMIGVFCSLDLVIFYLFFEAGLIPMFLIIGIWGGVRKVYKIEKEAYRNAENDSIQAEIINFSYANQEEYLPARFNSNFDAEALISYQDKLYIFTKNWENKKTDVYELSKTPGTYELEKIDTIETEGLITGATYDELNDRILLCGNSVPTPFIIELKEFSHGKFSNGKMKKYNLQPQLGASIQIEGITMINKNECYLSAEKSITGTSALYKYTFDKSLDQ